MSIFRKGTPQATSDLPPNQATMGLQPELRALEPNPQDLGINQLAGIDVSPVLELDKLNRAADSYNSAWVGVDKIISNADISSVLAANSVSGSTEVFDGSGRRIKNRKASHDTQDALLTTVLSARIKAVDRHSDEHTPFIFSYDTTDYLDGSDADKQSLAIFAKMREIGALLEGEFSQIEGAMKLATYEISNFIHKAGVDNFISWLRDASLDDSMASLMELVAQDVHDPRRGAIHEAVSAEVDTDSGIAMVDKFAEVIDQQDGELEKEAQIISFAAVSLKLNGIEQTTKQILSAQPVEVWPADVQSAFKTFKQARKRDIGDDLRKLTEGFYKKNRRLPSVDDLKKLEEAKIKTEQQTSEMISSGQIIKRSKVNISQDYATPDRSDVRKPREAQVALAKVLGNVTREIEISNDNPEAIIETVIDRYAADYKLDAAERRVAEVDIKKMIKALRVDATRNFGVTKLSEVKPFKADNGQTHTVWRLNPANYNGLSVSRRGKDTRIIYTLSNSGVIGIIGAYSHDDYMQQIKNLR